FGPADIGALEHLLQVFDNGGRRRAGIAGFECRQNGGVLIGAAIGFLVRRMLRQNQRGPRNQRFQESRQHFVARHVRRQQVKLSRQQDGGGVIVRPAQRVLPFEVFFQLGDLLVGDNGRELGE